MRSLVRMAMAVVKYMRRFGRIIRSRRTTKSSRWAFLRSVPGMTMM
jgi:hypothetical protein